jgi:quercetin dioxygenase-like cupin family protein
MLLSRIFLTVIACAALSAGASAAATPVIVTPETATWKAVPGFKGWEMATVVGDPSKAGAYYAYLLKAPDGAKAEPHFHKMTENVTVITGTFLVGLGNTMNVATMKELGPGTVASVPAGVHHYAMAKGPILIEVSGIGPDTITFVH